MALTVRREGVSSSGTISRPVPLAIDLSRVNPAPIRQQLLLGYEAIPSTAVWGFSSPRRFELKLSRDGSDRYAVHIQLTVINGSGQTVYAITRSDGQGEWLQLPAGEYRIIAALLIPEQVELGLTVEARPHRVRLGPVVAGGRGDGVAHPGRGIPLIAAGDSPHQVSLRQPVLAGAGGGTGGGLGEILEVRGSTSRCRSIVTGGGTATGAVAPMQWVDAYGRPMGAGILIVPVALEVPELVTGSDWAVQTRFIDASTTLPSDLREMAFTAEIWDLERSYRYAICSIAITDATAGGPVIATLTPGQTDLVGRYDGEVVLFELKATDTSGQLAYLLEGEVTVRWGVTTP